MNQNNQNYPDNQDNQGYQGYQGSPPHLDNNLYIIEQEQRKRARRTYNHCGKSLLLYFVIAQVYNLVISFLYNSIPYKDIPALYQSLSFFVTLIMNTLPFIICARFIGFDYNTVNRRRGRLDWNLICVGLAFTFTSNFITNIGLQIAQSILGRSGLYMDTIDAGLTGDVFRNILMMLLIVVVAPITEEFIFRGVLFYGFNRHGGPVFAMVASSLLFALLHGNFIQAIPTFMVGLVLSYLRYKTGSIKSSVVLHAINNSYAYLIMLVQSMAMDIIKNPITPDMIQNIGEIPIQKLLKLLIVGGIGLLTITFIIFCIAVTINTLVKRRIVIPIASPNERRLSYGIFFTSWAIILVLIINIVTCIMSVKPL